MIRVSCSTRGALKDFCACFIFLVIHLSFLIQLWFLSVQIILLLNKTGLAIWNFRYFDTETVIVKAWSRFPFHSQAQASKYHAWKYVFNLYHSFSDISFILKKIFIYLLLSFFKQAVAIWIFWYVDIATVTVRARFFHFSSHSRAHALKCKQHKYYHDFLNDAVARISYNGTVFFIITL